MLSLTWCRWKVVQNTTHPITDLDQTYVDQAKVVWAAICEGYTTEPADPEARLALSPRPLARTLTGWKIYMDTSTRRETLWCEFTATMCPAADCSRSCNRRAHLLRLRFPDYRVRSIGFLLRDILRNSRMVSRRPSRVREKQTITNDMSFTELSLQSE